MKTRTALVLIDTQVSMFDPASPVSGAEELLMRLTDLVSRSRAAQVPVVFVRNCGGPGDPDVKGSAGWELHPALQHVAGGEMVVDKTTCDAFASTPLDDNLKALGVTDLILAGLQSEYCIRETTLGALSCEYAVTLVSDGHSTYDSEGQIAHERSAAVNTELRGQVKLVCAQEVSFQ